MSAISKLLPFAVLAVLLVTVIPLAAIVAYSMFAEKITPSAEVEGEWNIFMGLSHLVVIFVTNIGWIAAIAFALAALVTILVGIPAGLIVLARRSKG